MSAPTVVIGFLHGAIEPAFMHSLNALLAWDAKGPQQVLDVTPWESGPNLSFGRNQLVRAFLEHPARPEWYLSVDSDMCFRPGLVASLTAAADPVERPILGALCFGLRPMEGTTDEKYAFIPESFPTLYTLTAEGQFEHHLDYPPGALVQVHATGAACLLVHRSVFVAIPEHDDRNPLRWFQEGNIGPGLVSEDTTFCLRAGAAGFPVFVATGIDVGHVKKVVVDARFHEISRQVKAALAKGLTDAHTD